ncbi:MAG TPA: MBL fold metallo-hydrolase [Bacillota bacterium]
MIVTLMGTGTSHGVPVLGCTCPTCTSGDHRDIRTRSSAYLKTKTAAILIDTAPELRIQALQNQIKRVDAVLLTHYHADHLCGFDDLRRFNELQGGAIPVYGNGLTVSKVRTMFDYIFDDSVQVGGGLPAVKLYEVEQTFKIADVTIIPIPVKHGRLPVNGYRIGKFAYLTDCSEISAASLNLLHGLEVLVLGVLRFRPHPTHLHLAAALEIIAELRPKRCILTHICHDFKHSESARWLPEGVELGYDGQQIEVRENEG